MPTTEERRSGTETPGKLSQRRQKRGQKAKQEPKFRFYGLYDRIYLGAHQNLTTCAEIELPTRGAAP